MKTTKKFILDAIKIHGNKYDYSISEYIGSRNKILIICKVHGKFFQTADDHLHGKGCKLCANKKLSDFLISNTSEFINKSKIIHGEKYDYSNINYINCKTKINIKCIIHGNFKQTPNAHLQGKGCLKCGNNIKKTTDVFITDARKIHGNKYDYSLVKYSTAWKLVDIICPKHNIFRQIPHSHLNGSGCPHCGIESASLLKISNTQKFIEQANIIHNKKYLYDFVDYKKSNKKVKLICKKHGKFEQTPNAHLQGKGCRKCNFEKISIITCSKSEIDFLNYIKIKLENRSKFIHGYIVDGYDPETNTIYEFLGDYWHGNPNKYTGINYSCKPPISFDKLYENTFKRFNNLKNYGYKIKYIWENEWNKYKNNIDYVPNIIELI